MQAIVPNRNVLGRESRSKTAVVVTSPWRIIGERCPPFLIFESHQTSRAAAMVIGDKPNGASWLFGHGGSVGCCARANPPQKLKIVAAAKYDFMISSP
jgi:hypothetical protein